MLELSLDSGLGLDCHFSHQFTDIDTDIDSAIAERAYQNTGYHRRRKLPKVCGPWRAR